MKTSLNEKLDLADTLSERKATRFDVQFQINPPFPREIFLDLSGACNHWCNFCANPKSTNKSLLDTALACRLLEEAKENGTVAVGLYATGEPFIHPDLAKITKKAKDLGIEYVFISTNGTLATPKLAAPVLDAGMDSIKFSVNGGDRESYKAVHGKDQFDLMFGHVKWFSEYREKSGLSYKIYVSTVQAAKDPHQFEKLTKLLSPYVDEFDLRHCSNQGGNMYSNNERLTIDPSNLLGSMLDGQAHADVCPDPFHRITVTPEGYATVCVVDYRNFLTVADLNNTTLAEAWNDPKFVDLRRRHLDKNLKGLVCHNCLYNCDDPVYPLIPEVSKKFCVLD